MFNIMRAALPQHTRLDVKLIKSIYIFSEDHFSLYSMTFKTNVTFCNIFI
jgi:hypothetical protein